MNADRPADGEIGERKRERNVAQLQGNVEEKEKRMEWLLLASSSFAPHFTLPNLCNEFLIKT